MKKMILLAAIAMSTLVLQASEPAQAVEINMEPADVHMEPADVQAAVLKEGDTNETIVDEETPTR